MDRGRLRDRVLAAVCVCCPHVLTSVPLGITLPQEPDWGNRLLCDGLHFTPAGQEKLWQLLNELLRREWPEIRWGHRGGRLVS